MSPPTVFCGYQGYSGWGAAGLRAPPVGGRVLATDIRVTLRFRTVSADTVAGQFTGTYDYQSRVAGTYRFQLPSYVYHRYVKVCKVSLRLIPTIYVMLSAVWGLGGAS